MKASLLLFLAILGLSYSAVIKQDVRMGASLRKKLIEEGKFGDFLEKHRLANAQRISKATVGTQPFTDYWSDVLLTGDISLGTPYMRTAFLLLALAALACSAVLKQNVHKHASLRAKMIKEGTWTEFIQKRQQANKGASQAALGAQPFVEKYEDFITAEISLGTPYQNFSVIIETASADLWVVDIKVDAAEGRNRFNSSASSTFTNSSQRFSIVNRLGMSDGYGYVDYDVFNLAGLVVAKQGFGLAKSVAINFPIFGVDGGLGLAWPSLSIEKVTPPMQNLLDQLDLPIFTMWLDGKLRPEDDRFGGLITYGGFDKEHCSEQVDYVILSSQSYWQFPLTRFTYGSESWSAKQQVILDSGEAWVGAPLSAVNAIVTTTGAKYDQTMEAFVVDCSSHYPDLEFTIGGKLFSIPRSVYVLDVHLTRGNCILALKEQKSDGFGADWVFGNVWLKQYCNVHDIGQKRIGFAKAL